MADRQFAPRSFFCWRLGAGGGGRWGLLRTGKLHERRFWHKRGRTVTKRMHIASLRMRCSLPCGRMAMATLLVRVKSLMSQAVEMLFLAVAGSCVGEVQRR